MWLLSMNLFFSVSLYYSREELCLSGVSMFSWTSTAVSLLREFYNMKTMRVQLCH